jgi:hypothetical protein
VWLKLFILLGIATICGVGVLQSQTAVVQFPIVLLASCLVLLIAVRDTQVVLVQRILGVYLCCVVVDQAKGALWSPVLSEHQIHMPACLLGLLVLVVARSLLALYRQTMNKGVLPGWSFMIALLACHIVVVGVLLQSYYSLDWEDSLRTLGWICVCYLVSWSIWPVTEASAWRRSLAAILILFYAINYMPRHGT